jgi:putative ABC transport system permease protein
LKNFSLYLRLLKESILFSYNALILNKLRTILSLLGITIGIFAIISVFTMVDTMENSIRDGVASLGDDVVYVQKWPWVPEGGDGEYAWWKYFQRPEVSYNDYKLLKERVPNAQAITFAAGGSKTSKYLTSSMENTQIMSTTAGYDQIATLKIEQGRYLTNAEIESGKNFAVIGNNVATNLFASANPIGKAFKIGDFKCIVAGVLEKEGEGIFGNSADNQVILPLLFGRKIININESDTYIMACPKPNIDIEILKDELISGMRSVRRLRPKEDADFSLNESSLLNTSLEGLFQILNISGAVIGGFSILVGGFSIANIMFVSVRERTPIIGIQKSLGAKNSFILFQFLSESVILCITGGLIGLILIYIITIVANSVADLEMVLSLKNILYGLGISIAIGLISGIVPAYMAARLDPVDAIRSN